MITRVGGHYAVQGHSRSFILASIKSKTETTWIMGIVKLAVSHYEMIPVKPHTMLCGLLCSNITSYTLYFSH